MRENAQDPRETQAKFEKVVNDFSSPSPRWKVTQMVYRSFSRSFERNLISEVDTSEGERSAKQLLAKQSSKWTVWTYKPMGEPPIAMDVNEELLTTSSDTQSNFSSDKSFAKSRTRYSQV